MQSRTQRLRSAINSPQILVMPGVFDGYSARLLEREGFAAGFVSGAGLSEALLGQPDVGLLSLEQNLFACRLFAACTDLPLLADADTGYGNAVNVFHTVRAFEQAGLAGVMIEDQTWPKRCGHMEGKSVIPAEEMVQKVRAAVDARRDPDFVIMARTDAAGTDGVGEAVRRLCLYRDVGADLLFADALRTEEDIVKVAQGVPGPVCVNMGFGIRGRGTTPLIPASRLEALGIAAVIYPRLLTSSAVRGMEYGIAALKLALAEGDAPNRPDLAASFEEINELVGHDAIGDLERRYAT